MQYTYTQTGVLQRTVGDDTYKLRTQLISVLQRNVAASTTANTVLADCVNWAGLISSLRGAGITYTDDVKVQFSKANCFVADTQASEVTATFICKRIIGTSPEYLQFTLTNITTTNIATAFTTMLDSMSGVTNAINNYIIVNAIIDK